PVNLLGRTVITGVLGIAELIGVAVQRTRSRDRLVGFATVHDIQEVGFDPPMGHMRIAVKTRKPFWMFEEILQKCFNGQVTATGRTTACVSIIFQPWEEHRQHTIHLDVLEIHIGGFRSPKLLVSAFETHASALLLIFPRCRMPRASRWIWKNSKPLS